MVSPQMWGLRVVFIWKNVVVFIVIALVVVFIIALVLVVEKENLHSAFNSTVHHPPPKKKCKFLQKLCHVRTVTFFLKGINKIYI